MSNEFIWPVRVYYEDTDAGGVVFYANYLKFFERGRSEWLNHLGIDQARLFEQQIAFAVRKAEVDYFRPARLNDQLQVVSRINEIRGTSLTFQQSVYQTGDRSQPLCEAVIKAVCLKLDTFTPCRIPALVREELQRVS